jgi:hypothetical protein
MKCSSCDRSCRSSLVNRQLRSCALATHFRELSVEFMGALAAGGTWPATLYYMCLSSHQRRQLHVVQVRPKCRKTTGGVLRAGAMQVSPPGRMLSHTCCICFLTCSTCTCTRTHRQLMSTPLRVRPSMHPEQSIPNTSNTRPRACARLASRSWSQLLR